MQKLQGALAKRQAAELRIRAEDAKRRASCCEDEKQKAMHLRRMEEFEKMASESEGSH